MIRKGKLLSLITTLLIFTVLTGCNSNDGEQLGEKVNFELNYYNMAAITGVRNSESIERHITNKKKLEEIINIISIINVKKATSSEINEITNRLKNTGSYLIGITDRNDQSQKLYKIIISNDGTLLFQHSQKDKKMYYMTQKKQPKIEKKIKHILNI